MARTLPFLFLLILGCAAPVPSVVPTEIIADTLHVEAFGPTFRDTRAVGVDPAGRIYVADGGDDRVHILAADGLPISAIAAAWKRSCSASGLRTSFMPRLTSTCR